MDYHDIINSLAKADIHELEQLRDRLKSKEMLTLQKRQQMVERLNAVINRIKGKKT